MTQKVALITGAIKGIGKSIALALAKQKGIQVVMTYHDWEEYLDQLIEDFSDVPTEYMIEQIDLLNTDSIPLLIEKIKNRFGRLDILVNNIERGGWPIVHGAYTKEQWDLEIHTTLRSKWWLFDSALPELKASGQGTVINISSIAGIIGRCGPAGYIFNDCYSAANRAVLSFTETWARLAAPEVRVNELMLGIFETRHANLTRGWDLLTSEQKQAIITHTPLKRIGRMDDIIKAVFFLIFDSPFMTGSLIRLDGGYPLGSEDIPPMPKGVV